LGKLITRHFRYHNNINVKTFFCLYKDSKTQISLLKKHAENPYLKRLFEKYDKKYEPYFKNDLANSEKC